MSSPQKTAAPNQQVSSPPIEAPDASQKRLTGKLGTFDIAFSVLAFNAPLANFVSIITVLIGFGNGLGAPVAYLGAGALILIFAVGFTSMTKYLPNPGAFYAYITAGLGRPLGLGSAFLANVSYMCFLVGSYALGGVSLQSLVVDVFSGPDLPWWLYALGLMAIVGIFGVLDINLSAKVLTATMLCEIAIIAAYNAVVFATGGKAGVTFAPFMPENIVSGSVGIAILFAVLGFGGFEATAVFREEARDPERTIPRATYIAVIGLGLMYAVTAWAAIIGIGTETVVESTAADPVGTMTASVAHYLGTTVMQIMIALLCTSVFAANLAGHNISTRYLYSLGKDTVLPRFLGGVHSRFGSPHRASLVVSGTALLIMLVLIMSGANGFAVYAALMGIAGYATLILMLLTSVAIFWYFRKHQIPGAGFWQTQVSPLIALPGFCVAIVLATQNIAVLIGGDQVLANALMTFFYALIITGIVTALVLRSKRPATYQRIGRQNS